MDQEFSRKKKIIFALVTFIILAISIEWSFRLLFRYTVNVGEAEKLTFLDAYKNDPLAKEFFADNAECARQNIVPKRPEYQRYVLHDINWICDTPYIKYHDFIRDTWNPSIDPAHPPIRTYEVGMFGGSTMLGLGSVDDQTIASQFSHLINTTGSVDRYHVTNYGVSSYTFTQALMKLILLLRQGKHFDYVIFYDGANDIDNAYDTGEAGALVAEQNVRVALDTESFPDRVKSFVKEEVGSCATCKAVVILIRHTPVLKDIISPSLVYLRGLVQFKAGDQKSDQGIEQLGTDIANYYAQSYGLLDALSRAYTFRYMTFWQPTLLSGDKPTPGEENLLRVDPKLTDAKNKSLHRLVTAKVNALKMPNVFDLSDALVGRTESYYLDAVHISGAGNAVVARRMFDVFAKNK